MVMESEAVAPSEVMITLRSLEENVSKLTNELHSLDEKVWTLTIDVTAVTSEFKAYKWAIPFIVGFGITVISIIAAIAIK